MVPRVSEGGDTVTRRQEKNSRPRSPEYGSCRRKRGYDSRAFAEQVAVKRWKRSGFLLNVYRCDHCAMFHLTRFPPKEVR